MSFRAYTRATAASPWIERDVLLDTVRISDTINERSTASLSILDRTGTLSFARGQGVRITLNDEDVFIGFIDQANERRLGTGGHRTHDLELVDLHYLADKRITASAHQNASAGSIVTSLITNELAGEGITPGLIETGPTLRAVTFNYVPVADAIARLATRAGFWWRITSAGVLDFAAPTSILELLAGTTAVLAGTGSVLAGATGSGAPPEVDLGDVALADTISIARRTSGYRNRQWIKGGRTQTVTQVETQTGDGEKRSFAVGFPLATEPAIEVDRGSGFVTETVGVAGLQEGQEWQWSFGSPVVSQYVSGAVLSSANRVRITYTGLFDIVARVDDEPEQGDRATVEGGTGIVENVLIDRTSTSQDDAFQLGGELVSYWKAPAMTARFVAQHLEHLGDDAYFVPGRTINVTSSEHGLASLEMLCTSVELFTRSGSPTAVVTLVSGPVSGTWAQWFGALSRRLDALDESRGGETEIVTSLESFLKVWTEAERPNIWVYPLPASDLFPLADESLVPAFEIPDRVLYLSWYFGGVELGRKAFTTRSTNYSDPDEPPEGPDELTTTTVLVTNDAVGDIDELGWWGGHTATAALGSGVEVDRQAFVKTKTDIEIVQVVKTDVKWEVA